MDEHSEEEFRDDSEQHPPRWVPYTPPPPDGWDRLRLLVRRVSFPLFVLLFLGALGGVYYWSTFRAPAEAESPSIDVRAAVEQGERPATGRAELTVRSTPDSATVRVNGDSIGVTPLVQRPLDSGVYMLSIRARGYFRTDTVLVVREETTPALTFALRPRPGTPPPDQRAEPAARPAPREPEPARRPLPETAVPPTADPAPPPAAPVLGALYVTSAPTGAVVTVDDTEQGRTPVGVSKLPVGDVRVTASLDGYETWSTRVAVRADTTRRLHAVLQPRTGRLRVLARPWGTIYVNGTLHARETDVWYETDLPAGTYRVTVVHPALGQRVQEVQVEPDGETAVVVDLQADPEASS